MANRRIIRAIMQERHGFTLIELMIAITITSGLLLAGRTILEQVSAVAHAITADAAANDTTLSHARLLRSIVRNLEVGPDSNTTFVGDERSVTFTSWCSDANVTPVRCLARLTVDTVVTLTTSIAPATVLMRSTGGGRFRYLNDARGGGDWYRSWGAGITAPLAIGIIVGVDTTVLRIGERG